MSKINLSNVNSLQNESTALSVINGNSQTIQLAMDNTLSRDGSTPNQMGALLDMNSNPIINLPAPTSNYMPLRLIDAQTLNGGGTVITSPLPPGGTTGQVLAKNSGVNYDVIWSSTVAGGAGGSVNSVQYNSSGGFNGVSLAAGQTIQGTSGVPAAAFPTMVDVTTMGIDNSGIAVVASALQVAINTITAAGKVVYIPNGTYNMGNGSITIPDNSTVYCGQNATLARTAQIANVATDQFGVYTDAMVVIGNNVRWYNGILNNTWVDGTSTTSNTMGTGTFTFTTQAGLPFVAGNFLRIWSNFNPSKHWEGTVTSYSGTTLTMNFSQFFNGTGSAADWNITWGGVYQCPMVLHNSSNSIIDGAVAKGNWYVGFLLDGWNPPAGGSLVCKNNILINCQALGIQNRGFYTYGTCNRNEFINCYAFGMVNGFGGSTDYGFNMNPANGSGSANSQFRNKWIGCHADSPAFQGFAISDIMNYNIIDGCTAYNLTNTAGTGFLVQQANGQTPQYNTVSNCIAMNCTGSAFNTVGSLYTQFNGCKAVVSGIGFNFGPSVGNTTFAQCNGCQAVSNTTGFNVNQGNHCDLIGIQAVANTTGVLITSGSSVTLVTGRSVSNTTNLSDSGTSTQSTGLVTI